jgi:sugar/nucleoside kinase (ribokinase family)
MSKQFDVIVVGELNVDLILNQIEQFPTIGKETLASHMNITLGSSSAIFASNLSTLGTSVAFLGRVGADNFGDFVISSLKGRNVSTDHIIRSVKNSTGATVVLNFGEDRANVTYQGAMKYLTIQDISDETLKSAKHLHLSSIFLQTGLFPDLVALFSKAKSLGLTTSIDPQWDPSEKWNVDLDKLLPFVDVFMPNISELKALTGTQSLEEGLARLKTYAHTVVVKHGSEGAYLWDGESLTHQPPFLNKEVVDSIGAGDSFDSGFIHAYLQKKSLKDCITLGALTGAINTTRPGGTGAFENLSLVQTIAKTMFNYAL